MRLPSVDADWLKRAVLAAVPLELFFVGYVLSPQASVEGSNLLHAGAVTLSYDAGWTRARGGAGLDHRDGSRLRVEPASAAALAADRRPRRIELAGRRALAYRSPAATDSYVFTLGDGKRVAVACHNATARDLCGPLLATVRVDGAVEPTPRPAVAQALRTAVESLSASARRPALRLGARRPAVRAAAARRLVAAHRDLARAAARLAGPGETPADQEALTAVSAAAGRVAQDFGRLARATGRQARRPYARVRARLRAHQVELRAAVAALADRGYDIERRARS